MATAVVGEASATPPETVSRVPNGHVTLVRILIVVSEDTLPDHPGILTPGKHIPERSRGSKN